MLNSYFIGYSSLSFPPTWPLLTWWSLTFQDTSTNLISDLINGRLLFYSRVDSALKTCMKTRWFTCALCLVRMSRLTVLVVPVGGAGCTKWSTPQTAIPQDHQSLFSGKSPAEMMLMVMWTICITHYSQVGPLLWSSEKVKWLFHNSDWYSKWVWWVYFS